MESGDQVFKVTPETGDLLPEDEEGTLFKVVFQSPAYGKVYQSHLIISVRLEINKRFLFKFKKLFFNFEDAYLSMEVFGERSHSGICGASRTFWSTQLELFLRAQNQEIRKKKELRAGKYLCHSNGRLVACQRSASSSNQILELKI